MIWVFEFGEPSQSVTCTGKLSLMAMWTSLSFLGEYQNAIEHFLKTVSLSEALSDTHVVDTYTGNVGAMYQSLDQYEESIVSMQKAMDIASNLYRWKSKTFCATFKTINDLLVLSLTGN